MTEATDWRDDPRWRLVEYVAAFYEGKDPPPPTPPPEAELAQPDCWASLYVRSVAVATWTRLDVGFVDRGETATAARATIATNVVADEEATRTT